MIESATPSWQPDFLASSALFDPLRAVAEPLAACAGWPSLAQLQQLGAASAWVNGKPLRFVPQCLKPQRLEEEYEPRIFLTSEVQTRSENWHDLFNALVWLAFPKAKAAINARHYAEIMRERESAGGKLRGKLRDRLTQFDESGVVILCADAELARLLADHHWQRLFWDKREQVEKAMRFLVFGHSLYEKSLQPYPGMTGKGLVFQVGAGMLQQPLQEVVASADGLLAGMLLDPLRFGTTTRLQPLPLMGVPGWTPANARPEYYQDACIFRPKRALAPSPASGRGLG